VVEYAGSINKIMELLRKVKLARAKYSREPKKILVVLKAKRGVVQKMEKIAKEKGVKLMIRKVVDLLHCSPIADESTPCLFTTLRTFIKLMWHFQEDLSS
jgi:hypothetical protein